MSKIALSIGPIQIYWYSVIILIAIFVAASIVYYEMKKQGELEMTLQTYSSTLYYLELLGLEFIMFYLIFPII